MALRRSWLLPGVLGLLAIAVTSCASGSPAASTSSTTTSTVVTTTTGAPSYSANATVTIAVPELPSNFNPWSPAGTNQVTQMVMEAVWPQVSVVNATLGVQVCTVTAANCPSALLVSAEPVSLNPMTVVYQIAPNAAWSDGIPVTGADFSYLRDQVLSNIKSLPSSVPIAGYEDIEQLTTSPDGKTVTVVFSKPYEDWQGLFADLVPAHVAIAQGFVLAFSGKVLANLVSAGPYRISHIVPGKEVVLGRNPQYWGPPAHIARIIFKKEVSEATTIAGLRSGKITVAQFPPAPSVRSLVATSTTLLAQTTYSPVLWQLAFNLNDPLVGSLTVRQAIAEAIDRRQLLADTIGLRSGLLGAASNRLFGSSIPGGSANDARYAAVDDVGAEAALVAEGYTYGADGLAITATGRPLVVNLLGPSGNSLVAEMEAQIQAQLLQIGVEVRISNEPIAVLVGQSLPTGAYQLAIAPFPTSSFLSSSQALYVPSHAISPTAPPKAPVGTAVVPISAANTAGVIASAAAISLSVVTRDVFGLSDPVLQPLFAQASSSLSPAAANDIYNEIDIQLWQDLPSVPLMQQPVTTVYSNSLYGFLPAETWPSFMFNSQAWNWTLNAAPTVTTSSTSPATP